MTKRNTTLSIAAVLAASAFVLQAPVAGAAGNSAAASGSANTAQSADAQGIPGVEVNVGDNASDRGLPGVEMNVGAQGDQDNLDQNGVNTRTLGAGADTTTGTGTMGAGTDTGVNADGTMTRPMRVDRG